MNKMRLVILLIILTVFSIGCEGQRTVTVTMPSKYSSEIETVTVTSTIHSTVTKTAESQPELPASPLTEMSRDDIYLAVFQRLNNLAKTPEAKEYVSLFLMNISTRQEVLKEKQSWIVTIGHGSNMSYDLIQNAPWFNANWDYFRETHWEVDIMWVVYNDARVEPLATGALIESDIQRLNTSRVLE